MKRLILLILINIWIADNQLLSMDRPATYAPIVLPHSEIIPFQIQLGIVLDQRSLDELIEKANKGDAELAYLLACYYYYGLTWNRNRDFNQAEYWFLKAQKKDYLPAYSMLVNVAMDQNNLDKWIFYANKAIERGFFDQNYNMGIAYKHLKKYKEAYEYFEKTIVSLEQHQNNPHFKWVSDAALVETANILKTGQLGFKDTKKAMDIFKRLIPSKNIQAIYYLALAYLYGNDVIQKKPRKAESLLLDIQNKSNPKVTTDTVFYLQALNLLGWIFEKGLINNKPNINKAVEYYKKEYEYAGKFHIARLILTRKIPGDFEDAKKLLADASAGNKPNTFAAFLYGTILLSEGDIKQGLFFLEKVDNNENDTQPMASLQLGIAYHYGFGVEQNEAKAKEYFQKILDDPDTSYRSLLLARGYLYLFGLGGVKKDITKGLDLINESKNKIDDVYFETEQLFPAIGKLRLEQVALSQKELIGEEPAKKVKKKKKKAPRSILPVVEEESEDNPFETTEKEWNEYFGVDDGSYVRLIDKKNKVFIINDPKREQQLTVKFETLPDRDLTDIGALKYHKRILERQGHMKKRLKHSTKYNHDFAEMLDYVIQYLGEYVPFVKDGSDKHDDQLIATVIRKDLKTEKELICKAEYTFGQKGEDIYVYHRLLRPIKVPMATP